MIGVKRKFAKSSKIDLGYTITTPPDYAYCKWSARKEWVCSPSEVVRWFTNLSHVFILIEKYPNPRIPPPPPGSRSHTSLPPSQVLYSVSGTKTLSEPILLFFNSPCSSIFARLSADRGPRTDDPRPHPTGWDLPAVNSPHTFANFDVRNPRDNQGRKPIPSSENSEIIISVNSVLPSINSARSVPIV